MLVSFSCCLQKKQRESAAKVWAVLKNCIAVLGIAAEEEKALWSLLAAVYHLGYAAVKRSEKTLVRGGDRFMNPAASQRAAAVLGVSHEDLGHFIFSPPRGVSMRIPSNVFGATSPAPSDDAASQSPSITSLTGGSPFLGRSSGWDSLSSFCMGLYEQAFNALILLINRYSTRLLAVLDRALILDSFHCFDRAHYRAVRAHFITVLVNGAIEC